MDTAKNILEGVKVGDELVYKQYFSLDRIVKVENVTKTMVVCNNGVRFRVSDGYAVNGDRWTSTSVRKPKDAEEVQKIKNALLAFKYIQVIKENIDNMAKKENAPKLSLDALKEVYVLVKRMNESITENK